MTSEPTASFSEKKRLSQLSYQAQQRDRLPTLEEVLTRKTLPPVCLYNFYLFMRDREGGAEYLDFWLDVVTHENRCKHFVKDIKRAGLEVSVEYPEYAQYNQSMWGDKSGKKVARHMSSSSYGTLGSKVDPRSADSPSPTPSQQHATIDMRSTLTPTPPPEIRLRDSTRTTRTGASWRKPLTRAEIRQSAERIYYKYIVPGAEKEVILPEPIRQRISYAIEQDLRDDPEIFQEAKHYVFRLMEDEAFPRFLKARAFGNMTTLQTMLRLILGLFFLFVGFSVEFSLIFLDMPRMLRLWGYIPLFFGILNLLANQTELCPIFGFLNISETVFLQFAIVREPFIRKLLMKKSAQVMLASLVVTALVTALFASIPGKRL